ncbi:MAG: LysM peptidoglycan-binding domain-containing protein [Acidobacteria bacterium]|nr:LysM peptidoglycan-binding domain-containing protein [Acidobacteriota bacterium]
MAAVEMFFEGPNVTASSRSPLRVVPAAPTAPVYRVGPLVANRRAARARMKARRRRSALAALVVISLVLLAWPGHAFGGTNGVGLSTDLASSSTLSSGMVYVVQPGDTIASIARALNPVSPAMARKALVAELRSEDVVTGEHVLIP